MPKWLKQPEGCFLYQARIVCGFVEKKFFKKDFIGSHRS